MAASTSEPPALPWAQLRWLAQALTPASRALTRRWRALASSRSALIVCFAWAFGEATVWPVIPDVALFVLVLAVPGRAPRLLLATLAGAAAGGVVTLGISWLAPSLAEAVVLHVPLVHARSLPAVMQHLRNGSLLSAFLFQPWSGIPFKLWAVEAVRAGFSPWLIAPCFVIGRALRFLVVALIATALGRMLQRRLADIAVPLILLTGPSAATLFYMVAIAG